jgi:hypothetical protein
MPYPGTSFNKHNKKLKGAVAEKAGRQAMAMERAGVPVGEAIATASKHGNKMMRKQQRKK